MFLGTSLPAIMSFLGENAKDKFIIGKSERSHVRVIGGMGKLLSLHGKIAYDQERQRQRRLDGRYAWDGKPQ